MVIGYTDDPNKWKTETIEIFKDESDVELYRNTIYTNYLGQVMLKVFKDNDTDKEWRNYFQYDSAGRLILHATPSAVTGHDNTTVGLVSSTHLKDSDGLIHVYEYGQLTDTPQASATVPGAVPGYFKNHKLKKGETDASPDTQALMEYLSHADGNAITIYPVGKNTVYRETNGGGAIATSYSYSWHGTSNSIKSRTTTFPTVTTAQNGPNSADTLEEHFDVFGKPTWTKDEDGFIHYREYDTESGAMTKYITDVDTDNTGDFTGLPTGFTNASGNHLKTDYVVDDLGRSTKITDPKGNVTYIVYKDLDKEVRTYPGWNTSTNKPTGPTRMVREDWTRSYTEQVAFSADPSLNGSNEPTGTETIGTTIERMTRTKLDNGNRSSEVRSYFSPGGLTYTTTYSLGTLDTHYYQTTFGYDDYGIQDRVLDGAGTITRTVRDTRKRPISTWIGTDDTPTSGEWSPTNNGGANMLKTGETQYDHEATPTAGVGNDKLTQSKTFADDSTSYITVNRYDWRDRLEFSRGPDNVATKRTYDNLSHVTVEETFADADTDFTIDSTELRNKTESSFDEEGKVYQSAIYEVSSGTAGDKLQTNNWYDKRGNPIKSKSPNSLLSKRKTDGAGRLVATYTSQDDAETAYGDADDVEFDKVIEQDKTIYDKASNIVTQTKFMRSDEDTTTLGELKWNSTADPEVVLQVTVMWYDKANRITHSVNYGRDNRSTQYVYETDGDLIDTTPANGIPDVAEGTPPEPPGPSNNHYRITKTTYNSRGQAYRTTDNLNRIHETTFDAEDRVLKTIENYKDGIVAAAFFDEDRMTEFVRIAGGRLSIHKAHNAKGSVVEQQETKYLYESVINKSWATNVIYPDSNDQNSSGTDQVKFTFDRLGRIMTRKDQRGSERTMTYDSAGRLSKDAVTTTGTDVDSTVLRIETTFDDLSRKDKVTSYSLATGGSVVNEVKFSYNEWRVTSKIEQANSGSVTTGTPAIDLNYSDGAAAGLAKFVRLTSIVYPGPSTRRTVYRNFPSSGTMGDRLDRLDNLAEDSSGTTKYVSYEYLGERMFAKVVYPGISGTVSMGYGTGGNYSAWNQYLEILDQRWTGNSTEYVREKHEYNQLGSRTNKDVVPTTAPPTARDEYYELDNLERLKKMNRGSLSSGTITDANANFMQHWSEVESTGNWKTFIEDTNGGGSGGSATQTRTHNKANEIQDITGTSWVDPHYDPAGNIYKGPKPGSEGTRIHLVYDAWNRLVEAKNDSGGNPGTTIATYRYNGLNQRVQKTASSVTYDYYFDDQWRILEIKRTPSGGSAVVYEQYVWNENYIDAVATRFRDGNLDSDFGDTDEKLYYLQDALENTVALMNPGGSVVERYAYDPYGKVTVFDGSWTVRSGGTNFGNEVLFVGYRQNPETGLYQVRNREYHPTTGAWMQRDPQEYHDGNNLYEYARTNPVLYSDSHGLFASGQGTAGYWLNKSMMEGVAAIRNKGAAAGTTGFSSWDLYWARFQWAIDAAARLGLGGLSGDGTGQGGSPRDHRPDTPDWGKLETSKGNCYRYATGSPAAGVATHQLAPSGIAGPYTCANLRAGAITDGARAPDPGPLVPCPEYHWRIEFAVAPPEPGLPRGDHHWYRAEDRTERVWTHKRGRWNVETIDSAGIPITEYPSHPSVAKDYRTHTPRGPKYTGCPGSLCWPFGKKLP